MCWKAMPMLYINHSRIWEPKPLSCLYFDVTTCAGWEQKNSLVKSHMSRFYTDWKRIVLNSLQVKLGLCVEMRVLSFLWTDNPWWIAFLIHLFHILVICHCLLQGKWLLVVWVKTLKSSIMSCKESIHRVVWNWDITWCHWHIKMLLLIFCCGVTNWYGKPGLH